VGDIKTEGQIDAEKLEALRLHICHTFGCNLV
jgi:hypothetical protein